MAGTNLFSVFCVPTEISYFTLEKVLFWGQKSATEKATCVDAQT